MRLYELNENIAQLLETLSEVEDDAETKAFIEEQLAYFEKDRTQLLEYIAKEVMNLRSESEACSVEIKRLKDKAQGLENRAKRLESVIDREAKGENLKLGLFNYRYRTTTRCEIFDESKVLEWAKNNGIDSVLKVHTEVSKTDVKDFLKSGIQVDGAVLVTSKKGSLS